MSLITCRVTVAGAELDLLVLASAAGGCIGVDLESGAFVRSTYPCTDEGVIDAFTVARCRIADPEQPPDFSRPEAVELTAPPESVSRMSHRRAERWLRPLRLPDNAALLGFSGPTVPYWTLEGDRPSLALVDPRWSPQVRWTPDGLRCRFRWRNSVEDLALDDHRVEGAIQRLPSPRVSLRQLQHQLGYRPHRMLVALTPPIRGYCHKSVVALLPPG